MSAPTEIRVIDRRKDVFAPGDIILQPTGMTVYCARCGKPAYCDHKMTESADGKITLSPSLICPREGCGAHYNVKENWIEWA